GMELGGGRRPLAAVEPPAGDAKAHELPVGGPPPATHDRVGEVEVTLPLAIACRGARAGADALVALGQEVTLRLRLGEQWGVLVEDRILVRDDLEVLGPCLREETGGVRPELGLELEVPDALVPPTRLAVRGQVDETVARDALVPDRARQLSELGGVVEVA